MKRSFVLIPIFLLLTACQPTPEEPFVVSKQDGPLGQGVQAVTVPGPAEEGTAEAAAAPALAFPDRWEEVFRGADTALQVWRVMLTPYVVRLPDSDDLLALPCYLVFFDYDQDWRKETWKKPDASFHVLVVSALDGSIIDPAAGY